MHKCKLKCFQAADIVIKLTHLLFRMHNLCWTCYRSADPYDNGETPSVKKTDGTTMMEGVYVEVRSVAMQLLEREGSVEAIHLAIKEVVLCTYACIHAFVHAWKRIVYIYPCSCVYVKGLHILACIETCMKKRP